MLQFDSRISIHCITSYMEFIRVVIWMGDRIFRGSNYYVTNLFEWGFGFSLFLGMRFLVVGTGLFLTRIESVIFLVRCNEIFVDLRQENASLSVNRMNDSPGFSYYDAYRPSETTPSFQRSIRKPFRPQGRCTCSLLAAGVDLFLGSPSALGAGTQSRPWLPRP